MEKRLTKNVLPEISEVDLVFRSKIKASLRPKVTDPDYAYMLLIRTWDKEKLELLEQFKVLLLTLKGRVLGIYEASSGGIDRTIVDARTIFAAALKANATAIIIAHNHPSGVAGSFVPMKTIGGKYEKWIVIAVTLLSTNRRYKCCLSLIVAKVLIRKYIQYQIVVIQ